MGDVKAVDAQNEDANLSLGVSRRADAGLRAVNPLVGNQRQPRRARDRKPERRGCICALPREPRSWLGNRHATNDAKNTVRRLHLQVNPPTGRRRAGRWLITTRHGNGNDNDHSADRPTSHHARLHDPEVLEKSNDAVSNQPAPTGLTIPTASCGTQQLETGERRGGVQSNALLALAVQGRLDCRLFLFANVGDDSEHPDTIRYVHDVAMTYVEAHGIELVELHCIPKRGVAKGQVETLWGRLTRPGSRSSPVPVRMANGAPGTRACSVDWKVKVVAGELRRRGAAVENPAIVALGISVDEIERAKPGIDFRVPYQRRVYPLLDLGLRRSDCQQIITDAGLPMPGRSACWFCLIWNLAFVACAAMISVPWEKFPLVAAHEHGRRWLQFTANIGRAPNTVLAYGRALEDHLRFCALVGADPLLVKPDVVAAWIGDLLERPAAKATIQLRVVAVRSFYDFLVEDGLRERNPVRRGQSGRRGGRARQGLVRRVDQAPWIPNESDWQLVLSAALVEPLRNRLMVALAYDGALRREELVGLQVGDFEPAYSLIRLRAETTKSKRSREVSYGDATARLFGAYLAERRQLVGRAAGPLLVSVSRRNHGAGLGSASWSKIVTGIASRAGVGGFTTHTFRHLRLTDLARAGWTIDQIAQYAGHRNLATTLRYIHLSGRELAVRLHRATASVQADRECLLSMLAVTP